MKSLVLLTVAFQFAFGATAAHAAPTREVEIKTGFLSGSSYKELPDVGKRGYVMGFTDGIFVSPLYGAPKKNILPLERCVVGMSAGQIVAIVEKWLADNPGRWHEQMNTLAFDAIQEACRR